jgi:hypothetical protein
MLYRKMRHIVFFLLIYFAFQTCLFGQRKSELDSIKKLVGDSLSRPNYQSLIEMFNENPATLDSTEGSIIYYGRIFNGYDPYRINFDEIDFEKLVGKGQYKAAIIKGEELLKTDPVNLEVLSILITCYNNAHLNNKKELTKTKVDLLTNSILMYCNGSSETNTLKIVSIGDEYAMMKKLKIIGLSRVSQFDNGSTVDTWQAKNPQGKRIDFFAEIVLNIETLSGKN